MALNNNDGLLMKHLSVERLLLTFMVACSAQAAFAETKTPVTPVPYLTPEEEAKTFVLQDGYRLELVVSDPIIKEPVAAAFDGNGRMFVAEMRTYMQDINGNNEHVANGRVSLHWSSKGDGVFDQHTTFIDHLLLPRMILSVGDGLLVNETDSNDLWLYRDTNGDGVADKKELLYAEGKRGGNLEHQQSGLIWDLDNWLYMTVNPYRLRIKGTNVLKEPIPPAGGQWGLCQDNYGKPWFVNAGGEQGPLHFQQPIVYGDFTSKQQFAPGFAEVWPRVGLADVQGGPGRFRPEDKTLNHFTATCGGEIYRGDRLPEDLRGDLLFAEPVGRLIRRAKVDEQDGVTQLRNAYEKTEFILSTDPNFRPVNIFNAPDGSLYIVDMYRGIIQEGNWVKEGSYLRTVVQQHDMDKNFGRGRIWRLVHDDFKANPQPRMQDESPKQLVNHLAHPSGWWRETAQKLLVVRGDKSVVPALSKMARTHPNHLARIHALWTLEGLDAVDAALWKSALMDQHPQVRIAAIRVSETFYKQGLESVVENVMALANDSDPNVVIQVMMTANLMKWPNTIGLLMETMANNPSVGVKEIGAHLLQPKMSFSSKDFNPAEKKLLKQGEGIYKDLCFACHGADAKGMPLQGAKPGITMAPPLAGSKTVTGSREGMLYVVLKGLTGPVNGKTYGSLMVPMESNDDQWIAAVTSYIRNGFGNNASLIDPKQVAEVRSAIKNRTEPWSSAELEGFVPQALDSAQWKVSASHNSAEARLAIDGDRKTRFTTGAMQTPGMWFQIELPAETTISGMQLNNGESAFDYPRGYKIEVSGDGQNWGTPVSAGKGSSAQTEITFSPVKAKFMRITQTDSAKDYFWSVHELRLFAKPVIDVAKVKFTTKAAGTNFE